LAFEVPQSIIERNNKTPKAALRLLDQLEHTDYGRQPNVIGNARFEIKHNTSTGRPLEPVTLPGEPVIDWSHTQWVGNVLAWIATIKPGMTRSDLLRVFTTEGGLSTRTHRTYVLKQCPTIKVDVEFSISGNEAEDKITQISRPLFRLRPFRLDPCPILGPYGIRRERLPINWTRTPLTRTWRLLRAVGCGLTSGCFPDACVLIQRFIGDAVKHDRTVIQPYSDRKSRLHSFLVTARGVDPADAATTQIVVPPPKL